MKSQEYTIKADKSKRKSITMYLDMKATKALIADCGDAAVILMNYYYSKAGVPNFEYTDAKSARALGWSIRKTKDIRLKLTKSHWYYEIAGRYNDGRYIKTFYLGKQKVTQQKELEHKNGDSDPLDTETVHE